MGQAIDNYVRKATWGRFGRARLEYMAELRTHLLERSKELMLEGFSEEEAEYLAVERMGALPRVFWLRPAFLFAALAAACASWLSYSYLHEEYFLSSLNYPSANSIAALQDADPLRTTDLVFDTQDLTVRLPEAATAVHFRLTGHGEKNGAFSLPVSSQKTGLFHRAKLMTVAYRLDPRKDVFEVKVVSGTERYDIELEPTGEGQGAFFLDPWAYMAKMTAKDLPSVPLERWTPIAVLGTDAQTPDAAEASTVLYVFAASDEAEAVADPGALAAEDLSEVLARHEAIKYGDEVGFRTFD